MISPATLPPPVRPGDRVGVAALSGKVDPVRLAAGLAALEALGYEPVEAANLRSCCGLFAGSDQERVDAFEREFASEHLPRMRAEYTRLWKALQITSGTLLQVSLDPKEVRLHSRMVVPLEPEE